MSFQRLQMQVNLTKISLHQIKNKKCYPPVPKNEGPFGIAYDSAKGEMFVINSGSSNVSVISD